jgi:hypothetical protein
LLSICWHCGRATGIEHVPPAPAQSKPEVIGGDTSHAPASFESHSPAPFGLDQLVEQLDLEPDVVSTPPLEVQTPRLTTTASETAPPPAIAPPPVMPSAGRSARPAFAPQVAFAAVAAQLRERVPDWRRYKLPILGAAGLGLAVLVLLVMGRPNSASETASAPASAPRPATAGAATPAAAAGPATSAPAKPVPAAPVTTAPAAATPAPAATPVPVTAPVPATAAASPANVQIDEAPGWVMPRRVGFARDGSRTVTLQVDALRDIQVSRQAVRPVLAVRCLSRLTEVFVALGTSANIEAGDTNRVTVQLDDQTPSVQQWLRTHTYQELFAPDGLTLARQLVGASLMRFTFTPFGSRPVVAEFNVKGFDQHVATVSRTCAWPGAAGTSARKR